MGGFLVAHSMNAFVAEALYLPPEPAFVHPPEAESGASRGSSSERLASVVQGSGLFVIPATPLAHTTSHGLGFAPGTPGAPGMPGAAGASPVRASIGAAAKIRLIGVVFGNERGVFAIVEELGSKRQALYRLHEQIPEIGEVTQIRPDGMLVRQGGLEELLELSAVEKPVPTTVAAGTPASQSGAPLHRVVDRREVEQAMSDLPKLMTQARAVPNMVNGSLNGFRIDYIAPASFYEKIGIQSGDVLQRVNGIDIRDPSTMFNLFQQLKNERTVKLDMVRNNQRSTMTYELR
jgi:general secretion pathway protein C